MARVFRRATEADTTLLNDMTLAGIRHWGHDVNFPQAYAGLAANLPSDEDTAANPIFVLEEEGEPIAFHDLRDRGDHVELLRMFQRPDLIGTGLGRILWEHAVGQARQMGDRMLIMSDPEAEGFYAAMGATVERHVDVDGGPRLGVYWFDLRDGVE